MLEPKLLQKISYDADHGVVVIHHQNRHRQINRHLGSPATLKATTTTKPAPGEPAAPGHPKH
jgi:hypothetical protein